MVAQEEQHPDEVGAPAKPLS